MAIVTDPDNLDRNQVIFGTNPQKLSLYPVGSQVSTVASSSDAYCSSGGTRVYDANASFTDYVTAGDIFTMRNTSEARHYIVSAIVNNSTLALATDDGFTGFTADASGIVYDIRAATGGSIADGVTMQALYSFAKEEWRTDTYATVLSDNLIRHEFPFEAITSEQFEIGGGDSHLSWEFANDYTRKKLRTGGWANKDSAASTKTEYAGIITLGTLEANAQVYYQQSSTGANPTNFTFLGAVNEPILTLASSANDYRSFLKIFVRTKAKTYAQSEIGDIGVTQLQTIVNRFPLTHADDAAITAQDGQILGQSPFRTSASVVSASTGQASAVSSSVGEFIDASGPFAGTTVAVGDMLYITGAQTNNGYYTIISVLNTSTLRVDTTEDTMWSTASGLDYDIFTPIRVANTSAWVHSPYVSATTSAGASAGVAVVSANTADFVGTSVAVNDVFVITSSTSSYEGVYNIVSVLSSHTLYVDSTDNPFGNSTGNDFKIYRPGMFLQYKSSNVTIAATASVSFSSATRTATRTSGSWVGDGVSTGTIVVFSSTTSNNIAFTVASVGVTTLQFVSTDSSRITNETVITPGVVAYNPFKRTINNVVYGFRWKLLGNGATAANCYQFIQHQLRQTTDIDYGPGTARGDVTDLLMTFATPTGTTTDLIIDNINADDTNNVTYYDATNIARSYPFVASLTLNFNTNLQSDSNATYRVFFTNDDTGDNSGRDFGTKDAITVQDSTNAEIAGNVGGSSSKSFTYDYDGNTQRGTGSDGTDAPITIVAIGLSTAQYVITTGTITRSKGLTFSLVSPLERNYSNP